MSLADIAASARRRNGSGNVPLRTSSAPIMRLLELDPQSGVDRGRRQALLRRLTGPDAQLASQLVATLDPPIEKPAVEPHPMVLTTRPRRRPLGAGDVEFLKQVQGRAPSQISAEDAQIVAELEATVESAADRRLVAQVAQPLRRHLDRQREEAPLRAEINAASTDVRWDAVQSTTLPVLAGRLTDEAREAVITELGGADAAKRVTPRVLEQMLDDAAARAQQTATTELRAAWEVASAARRQRKAAAEQRLTELAWGADPKSSAVDHAGAHARDEALEAGRERARQDHPTPAALTGS